MNHPHLMPKRTDLASYLRDYGEDALAERALLTTDKELDRIAVLGAHYAFSDVAMRYGGSMGGMRALALAALDVLEGSGRDLRRPRSPVDVKSGLPGELTAKEAELIRMVRSTAPR